MHAKPIVGKYSWVGLLNIVVIQWFFVRIEVTVDAEDLIESWRFIGPIVPVTGWFSPYIYIPRRKSTPTDKGQAGGAANNG